MSKLPLSSASPVFTVRLDKQWEGAFWKVVSCACFAAINGIVRHCSGGASENVEALPVNVLMFFQNIFGTLFLLPWILKSGLKTLYTKHPISHFIRVMTAVGGIYLWYLALQRIPIAESVALSFTGPIFTVIGAYILLKENIDLKRFMAVMLSVIGAFVITRPDLALRNDPHALGLSALFPLGSALALALNKLLTRQLANAGETPTTLALYLLVLMIPVSLLPALYEWKTPSIHHWGWLILLGALSAGAHLSFGKAYQLAEVTFLTPFGFTKFFLSALIGFLAFSEFPAHWSLWIGIFIIFLSIILLSYRISLYSIARRFKSS